MSLDVLGRKMHMHRVPKIFICRCFVLPHKFYEVLYDKTIQKIHTVISLNVC